MQSNSKSQTVHYQRQPRLLSIVDLQKLTHSMSLVYFWMVLGIATTGGVAFSVWQHPVVQNAILGNSYVFNSLLITQFLMVVVFSVAARKCGFLAAFLMYFSYAALTGVTLSIIFVVYQLSSILQIFAGTTVSFLGLAISGYVTKRDLTRMGTFCMSGVWGLIGIYLLAIFVPYFRTDMANMALSALAVLIFSGLTAYDVQKIKNIIAQDVTVRRSSVTSLYGALQLYLDFLNLFLNLLRLFGRKR